MLGLVVGLVAVTASGATRAVPGSYATVEAALAAAQDGDIIDIASGTYDETALLEVYNFTGLTIRGAGAGVTVVRGGDDPVLFDVWSSSGVVFEDLTLDGDGARRAFIADASTVSMTRVDLVGGAAPASDYSGFNGHGALGFVLSSSTVDLIDVDASGQGFGIGDPHVGGHLAVFDSTVSIGGSSVFAGGQAARGGSIHASGSQLDITGATFSTNYVYDVYAAPYGGAIYALNSTVTVDSALFADNEAEAAGGFGGFTMGGAVYGEGSDLSITGTEFADNSAGNTGGAVAAVFGSGLDFFGNDVHGNASFWVGGVICWSAGSPITHCRMRDNEFNDNTGTGRGAGAFFYGVAANAELTGNTFCHNHVLQELAVDQGDGGGAFVRNSAVSVKNNLFFENDTVRWGGGLAIDESSNVDLHNNTFVGNGADELGSAVWSRDSTVDDVNNLYAYNTASAAARTIDHVGSGSHALSYAHLYMNTDGGLHAGVGAGAGVTAGTDPMLAGYVSGTCDKDTMLQQFGSPLVDSGDPALLDPAGSRSDVGVFGGPGSDPSVHIDADDDDFDTLADCNDGDDSIHPGASEVCDAADVDEDCNGFADNLDGAAVNTTATWPDSDGDGHGDIDAGSVDQCIEAGWSLDNLDCDDGDGSTWAAPTWYFDGDSDGFGDPGVSVTQCDAPANHVDNALDCNDGDGTLNPDTVWYADADNDGFGDPLGATATQCTMPVGFTRDSSDCNDADDSIHPGASEVCDAADVDEDCNGFADNLDGAAVNTTATWPDSDGDGHGDIDAGSVDQCLEAGWSLDNLDCDDGDGSTWAAPTWYFDGDSDGFGDPGVSVTQCDAPANHVDNALDCADGDGTLNPDTVWYADADNDGFGDPLGATATQCTTPVGFTRDSSDCDDGDGSLNPDTVWFADLDGDGAGDAGSTLVQCLAPADHVRASGDCDDTSNQVFPGALEQCDELDNDCDGSVDEEVVDVDWYLDADSDGWASADGAPVVDCRQPSPSHTTQTGDCDDALDTVYPGAVEYCDDLDRDCDGDATAGAVDPARWYADADDDGFGDATGTTDACDAPPGYVAEPGDCDDTVGTVFPGADELCDEVDNDCDGSVDDEPIDAMAYFTDDDGDGFGIEAAAVWACAPPQGHVAMSGDCDDTDAQVNPAASELSGMGDVDCDGKTAFVGGSGCSTTGGPGWWWVAGVGLALLRSRQRHRAHGGSVDGQAVADAR